MNAINASEIRLASFSLITCLLTTGIYAKVLAAPVDIRILVNNVIADLFAAEIVIQRGGKHFVDPHVICMLSAALEPVQHYFSIPLARTCSSRTLVLIPMNAEVLTFYNELREGVPVP